MRLDNDPPSFSIEPVELNRQVDKYSLIRRPFQERAYDKKMIARVKEFRPEVVLSGSAPPNTHRHLLKCSKQLGARFLFWVQDIYSIATKDYILKRLPVVGRLAHGYLHWTEFSTMRASDQAVVISEDFQPLLEKEGVDTDKITVIENWSSLSEIVPTPKNNEWAQRHGLADHFVFLYSGTLGMKHNPSLLAALARKFRDKPDVRVVVVTEGLGRDWLEDVKKSEGLDNLLLFDYQPYKELSQVLATGDVLVALLEPLAGVFSVPSKVLSYFCSERPLLAAMPTENLATRTVQRIGAGLAVRPDDEQGFLAAAAQLYDDEVKRQSCAAAARAYAETTFNIDVIGERFLKIMEPTNARRELGRAAKSPITATR